MGDLSKEFEKSLGKEFRKSASEMTTGKNNLPIEDYGKMMTSLNKIEKEVKEDEDIEKEETKEATGAGSAGGFEAPLFGGPKKNTLFQPGTETKLTKPKGGPVNEDEIPGGLADGMTLKDLAKHHDTTIDELIDKVSDGINIEMEHTSSIPIALEIALDHIYEDLDYYGKLEKIEAKEATTSASVGAYDVPFGSPKKDPLKIEKSVDSAYKKLRSVKDPNFPKLGGPGSTFVKVKNKCKKFPYCNQGDIKALEFFENNLVKEGIKNISKRYNLNEDYIKGVILENTNIYYKNTNMNKEIENMIDGIVEKVLSEEVTKKAKEITEAVSGEIDEMEEYYEIAKRRKEEREEFDGRKSEVIGVYSDIAKQRKEMGEEEIDEQNAFTGARCKAGCKGGNGAEIEGFDGKTVEGWSDEDRESCECDKSVKESVQLSEEEMIDLIEKIIKEQGNISGGGKIQGVTSQKKAMKTSEKETKEYHKDFVKRMKEYLKGGSEGSFETEPKVFPQGNGELKKMEKMAYTPSPGVEEYIDQIARSGGMENLDYDQIKPNEEWLDKNIVGSSETGNSDEYANAVATDANKGVKKRKDDNILAALKKQSYNKAPQPVTDFAGHHTNDEKLAGIQVSESKENKKEEKLNENIDRMKKLFSHNYKTQ